MYKTKYLNDFTSSYDEQVDLDLYINEANIRIARLQKISSMQYMTIGGMDYDVINIESGVISDQKQTTACATMNMTQISTNDEFAIEISKAFLHAYQQMLRMDCDKHNILIITCEEIERLRQQEKSM